MIKKIFVHINAYLIGIVKLLLKEKNIVEIIIKDPKNRVLIFAESFLSKTLIFIKI